MDEFELIRQYFGSQSSFNVPRSSKLIQGPGDDAALLDLSQIDCLAITTDTFNANVHFLPSAPPHAIATKVLGASLSDLAAIGALPLAFSLSLSLPEPSPTWLEPFSTGLTQAAKEFNVALAGGDTTRGPLTISITAYGHLPPNQALLRKGAKVGDKVFISGTLGDAAAAVVLLDQHNHTLNEAQQYMLNRYYRPQPRLQLGIALRKIATAAIDISDGLLADLKHLLAYDQLGAILHLPLLPISQALLTTQGQQNAYRYALSGGDDYELCFTASDSQSDTLQQIAKNTNTAIHPIGEITATPSIQCLNEDGTIYPLDFSLGYNHFKQKHATN